MYLNGTAAAPAAVPMPITKADRIEDNGTSDYRASFAASFLSTTFLNSRGTNVLATNQLANGYFNNDGSINWVQGNRWSQKAQYGTVGRWAQSMGRDADYAYIENATFRRYKLSQRTFYTGLFMTGNGANFEHTRRGVTGNIPLGYYGIFMYTGFHY